MAAILEKLNQPHHQLPFAACFTRSEGKNGVVVAFLAVLELSKEGLIDILQSSPYDSVAIRARVAASSGH
jgi:segregation and condensation protein A